MNLDEKNKPGSKLIVESFNQEFPGKENIPPEFIVHSTTEETKYEWLQRQRVEMNEDENRHKIIEMLMAKHAKGSEKHKKSSNMKIAFNLLLDRGFSYHDAFELIFLLYE